MVCALFVYVRTERMLNILKKIHQSGISLLVLCHLEYCTCLKQQNPQLVTELANSKCLFCKNN